MRNIKSYRKFNENIETNNDKVVEFTNSFIKSIEELENKINGLNMGSFNSRDLERNIKLIKTILQDFNTDNYIDDCNDIIESLHEIMDFLSGLKRSKLYYKVNLDINIDEINLLINNISDLIFLSVRKILEFEDKTTKSSDEKGDLIGEIESSLTPLLKQFDLEISKRGEEYKKWIGFGDVLLKKISNIKNKDYTNFEIKHWLGNVAQNFIGLARYPRSKNDVELTNLIDDILKIIF